MRDKRDHTKIHMIYIFGLLQMDVTFAYWPFLQLLVFQIAYIRDGSSKFVDSFT